jgi:hypothetical protein
MPREVEDSLDMVTLSPDEEFEDGKGGKDGKRGESRGKYIFATGCGRGA